jgi:hypothetical protein
MVQNRKFREVGEFGRGGGAVNYKIICALTHFLFQKVTQTVETATLMEVRVEAHLGANQVKNIFIFKI